METCVAARDDLLLTDKRILLYLKIGTQGGEALIESVSYDRESDIVDPRLLGCLYEMVGGDVLPAEVLDVIEDGVLTVVWAEEQGATTN